MLPDLHGLRVLDLGCGFGWFCRWAVGQGASQVIGIDLSENMLSRARAVTFDPAISYLNADLERLDTPAAAFELAYSSLALHYLSNLEGLFLAVQRALVPGGRFVMSLEHPILMAPTRPRWMVDREGRRTWPLDTYLVEGPRITDWLARGVVKQNRTIATTITLLIRYGFTITALEEWGPTDEQIATCPD